MIIDYISDKYLYPPRGIAPEGMPGAAEVRQAVLDLMLNPNAMYERTTVLAYANFQQEKMMSKKGKNDNEYFSATLSIVAGLIARGMHRYDRYSRPLSGFLHQCFQWAERQLLDELRAPENPSSILYDPDFPIISDISDDKPYLKQSIDQMKAQSKVTKHMDRPYGRMAIYPLRALDLETHEKAAIGYFLHQMSEEELIDALDSCEQHGTPVDAASTGHKRTYSEAEKQAIFVRFATWWNAQPKPPGKPYDLAVFERHFVYGENETTAYVSLQSHYPDCKPSQAHNGLYNKAKPAYKEFAKQDSQLIRDTARDKLYEAIKKNHT